MLSLGHIFSILFCFRNKAQEDKELWKMFALMTISYVSESQSLKQITHWHMLSNQGRRVLPMYSQNHAAMKCIWVLFFRVGPRMPNFFPLYTRRFITGSHSLGNNPQFCYHLQMSYFMALFISQDTPKSPFIRFIYLTSI